MEQKQKEGEKSIKQITNKRELKIVCGCSSDLAPVAFGENFQLWMSYWFGQRPFRGGRPGLCLEFDLQQICFAIMNTSMYGLCMFACVYNMNNTIIEYRDWQLNNVRDDRMSEY